MEKDNLGNRMKTYESKVYLDKSKPIIIRVDGKCFHTYTRGMNKPFDSHLMSAMDETAIYLLDNVQDAKLAYVQSDEISILVYNTNQLSGHLWFGGEKSKIESVASSMATACFNRDIDNDKLAHFDARANNYPNMAEAVNCFLWRMYDWRRNFISSVSYSLFSHRELQNKNAKDKSEMIAQILGENWKDKYTKDQQLGRMFSHTAGNIVTHFNESFYKYDEMKNLFINHLFIPEYLFGEEYEISR